MYSESQAESVLTSLNSTFTSKSQLSVAVKVSAVGTLSHSTVSSVGSASLKVGAAVSITVIVCVSSSTLPQLSIAFHVRFSM